MISKMGMYKEVCKTCGWTVNGQDAEGLKTALTNHVKEEHETLAEKHKAVLTDVCTFLDECEQGTKKQTKKKIRDLRNRVAELVGIQPEAETGDDTNK